MKYTTKHHVTLLSHNVKTGPMTVTRSTTDTCPKSCPLLDAGCYDQAGNGGIHRRKVDALAYKTPTIDQFFEAIPDFSRLYRLNEGGDLWSGKTSEHISHVLLKRFTDINKHWRKTAIVYTHKPCVGSRSHWRIREANRKAIKNANATHAINVSVESLSEVDEAFEHGLDVVTVLPLDANEQRKRSTRTPEGKLVVHCPATWGNISCAGGVGKKACGGSKGALCAIKNRDFAIGFPAHGSSKKRITKTLKILNNAA